VPWEVACDRNWLNVEKSRLIAGEKSAEGIVGHLTEGLNGSPREGMKRVEGSRREESE
jgi:hypothetical protein